MEAVRAFNNELSSLYETRPPVSRAKMASVTKHAIKAIKFYKHVVQSVEKFVQKCKPEYKVPGLYVIDSIVRQSRHQFGPEKDVFAPRFTKNIVSTFQNLFKCPPEEKCRVVRVLNLWQKNAVFPVEVIQPLLDLAAEPNNVDLVLAAQRAVEKVVSAHQRNSAMAGRTSNGAGEASLIAQQSEIVNTVTKLLEQTGEGNLLATAQEGQLQQLQLLQQQLMIHTEMMSSKPQAAPPVLDSNLLAQIKLLTDQLLSKTSDSPTPTSHNSLPTSAPSLPPLEGGSGSSYGGFGDGGGGHSNSGVTGANSGSAKQIPEPGFNRKLLDFDYGDSDDEEERKEEPPTVPQTLPGEVQSLLSDPSIMQRIQQMSASLQNPDQHQQHYAGGVSQDVLRKQHLEQQQQQFDKEISQNQYQNFDQREEQSDVIVVEDDGDERDHERDYDRDHRRSRRSRDRSRSPRRRRHSRSRSRERRRSRDRHRRSRSRDHEREQQREKERERKKRGLPTLKDKHVGICSRTLWFGHLAKHTTEDELRAAIEQYGTIDAINMIPPRGCAFVCMTRRKEAAKALDRLKGFKLNSSSLRVAWAPGIGVKESSFKDHWDVEQGVTYIPWSKLPADLSPFVEGGTVDEESLPEHLRGTRIGQDMDEDGDSRSAPQSESQTPQMTTPLANFTSMPGIPASQQLHMIPPHLMVPLPNQPPPRSIPPTSQIPPHSLGQMSLLGQSLPGQSAGPPQGLAASLQAPGGTPVMSATAPISLPSSVSHAQAVSVAASILGAGPNLSISMGTSIGAMDRPSGQLVGSSGMPGIGTGSPLLAQGPQQAAVLARPGFPPPGQLGAAGFGIPPNVPPRPAFPLPGQALRPPFQHLVEKEMDEPKEWPADDSILEEEALEELEQDTDHRMGIPPGLSSGAQGDGRGPAPLMSLPMMGMRMRLPGPGGPHRMGMPLPGIGGPTAPQPGMMVEVSQPGTAAAMAGLPVGTIGPGGMLGPRLMRPGGPQAMPGPDGAENMIRSPVPGLMGPQGAAAAMGLRLGMGNQGPRGIGPGNMAMGQRMPGLPGSPGLRGMGPGGGPIRIVLGNQQNPRPPGPGGMGVRPGGMGMDALRAAGMPGPRNVLEEMQGPGAVRSVSGPGPSEGNGLLSPGPGGLLQGLMMGAALRGGRPGLLGLRPNMPMNSGFRFNPQQPMGINFRGLRPDFLRPPGVDKPLDGGADRLGLTLGGAFMGRSLENEEKSPEYGDGFEDEEDNRENLVPRDSDFRAGVENDVSMNSDTRNSKAAAGSIGPDLAEMAKPRDRAGRQSRWSDVGSSDSGRPSDSHAETNGPALAGEPQSAAQDQAGLEAVTVNPMGGSQAVEGVAEG